MNSHMVPLDKDTCDKIHPRLHKLFETVHVKNVLQLDDFIYKRGYTPCISSIFLVGDDPCGSYDANCGGLTVHVKNGTLSRVQYPDDSMVTFKDIGDRYRRMTAEKN